MPQPRLFAPALYGHGTPTGPGVTGQLYYDLSTSPLVSYVFIVGTWHQVAGGGGGNSGIVLVASGTVTDQEFFEISLSASYARYELESYNADCSASDDFAFVFSTDGGNTYHQSANDYEYSLWYFAATIPGAITSTGDNIGDLGALAGDGGSTVGPINSVTRIFHKDDYPYACAQSIVKRASNSIGARNSYQLSVGTLYADAGNATNIAFFPYGDAVYPPTSGETLSFDYRLWGIP